MPALVVTYPMVDGARFDTGYYVDVHIPLVEENWRRYGLTGARAFTPDGKGPAIAAVAVLEFTDAQAIDAALASSEAGIVFGDIAKFTDLTPVAQKCR